MKKLEMPRIVGLGIALATASLMAWACADNAALYDDLGVIVTANSGTPTPDPDPEEDTDPGADGALDLGWYQKSGPDGYHTEVIDVMGDLVVIDYSPRFESIDPGVYDEDGMIWYDDVEDTAYTFPPE
jgi:hypothetical protein